MVFLCKIIFFCFLQQVFFSIAQFFFIYFFLAKTSLNFFLHRSIDINMIIKNAAKILGLQPCILYGLQRFPMSLKTQDKGSCASSQHLHNGSLKEIQIHNGDFQDNDWFDLDMNQSCNFFVWIQGANIAYIAKHSIALKNIFLNYKK